MGPITFDVIEVGDDRPMALRRAQAVRDCGVRADLTEQASGGFRLMVRSEGGDKARAAIEQQIKSDTENDTEDDTEDDTENRPEDRPSNHAGDKPTP